MHMEEKEKVIPVHVKEMCSERSNIKKDRQIQRDRETERQRDRVRDTYRRTHRHALFGQFSAMLGCNGELLSNC